jgi:hypothetical protein
MRSRRIYFKATGLKPNTRHFAYFDDNNITAYATTLNGDDSPNANSFEDFRYRRLNSENRIDFFDQTASQVFTTLSDTRRNLTTDNAGTLEGYFIIPNNNTLKFSTGSINFTLTDTDGGIEDLNRLSEAKAIYRATGTQYDYYDSEDGEVHVPSPPIDSEVGPTAPRRPSNPGSGGGDPIVEPDALPVYVLSRSHEYRDNGESFTITLTNNGGSVADGTTIPFLIQGVTTSDFSGTQLTGTFTLTSNTASVTYTVTTTEVHTFQLKLYDNTEPSRYDDVNPILVGFTEGETYVDEEYNCEGNYNYYEMVYLDPLAQSFNVGQFGIDDSPQVPEGIDSVFIKSLDLYFKGKDSAKPVSVQIVEVLNGYPYSSKIIKNGVVSLESSQVNISDDASSATTFTFPSAVHLETNREYAFIVRSTSPDYTVWMAELGGEDISSGERIDKDPYLGVAFRSSNASTWTPVQTRDIKFTLNAHTFLAAGETTRTKTVGPAGTLTGAFETIPKNTPFTVSSIQFSPAQILPPKTEINYTLSIGGNSYSLTPDGADLYLPSAVTVSSASDITLGATLTSSNQYATPVVDLDKISLLCNGYVINNDVTNETNAASGNATARYISKKVFLNDPADKLNVYLGVSQPEGSRVRLYARFDDEIASPQVLDLRDATWTELSSSRISDLSSLGDNTPFQEVEYEIDPTNDFTQFQLKIVMTSSDAAQIPAVTDLRAIATI